MFEHIVLELNL